MPESIKPVVIFALSTGLRRLNILDLEWTQVDMQMKVAWINPENAKAGKAIGVALNEAACKVLKNQIGKHSRWVFVHTRDAMRPDETKTPAVRKMRGEITQHGGSVSDAQASRAFVFTTFATPGQAG